VSLDFNEIRQLLATIAQTDISEVNLKSDNFELTVRKGVNFVHQVAPEVSSLPQPNVGISPSNTSMGESSDRGGSDSGSATQPSPTPTGGESKFVEISSPMVGTFYRAPAPGESAFVEVGDRIRKSDTVCIIEAMKLMNEIEAELSGQVMEILVENGSSVEYGQALMRINPD
jgi:acetyl-CoA carboxylase biotin carboxyl carrier protein